MSSIRFAPAILFAIGALPIVQSSLVATSLAAMRHSFDGELHAGMLIRLSAIGPAFAVLASSTAIGRIIESYDKRRVLAFAVGLYATCSLWAYVSSSLAQILASRIVLGISLAIVPIATQSLLADYYDGIQRGRMIGRQASIIAACSATVPIVGGFLIEVDWRTVYLVCTSAIVLAPAAFVLPRTNPGRGWEQGYPGHR